MTTSQIRLPLLNNYIELWARETPGKPAMIQHEDGKTVSSGKETGSPPCWCSSPNTWH
jgi:hypothetical protein